MGKKSSKAEGLESRLDTGSGRNAAAEDAMRLERETRRRHMEIIIAAGVMIFVVIATYVQLAYFGTDSWVFFVLLNINAVLMLIVLFLVARNVAKLLMERRRKIFGSRLRTRMVLAFFSISLVPVLLMFLASNRVLTTTVNYWFASQVENSMQAALEVGQSFYDAAAQRLEENARLLLAEIKDTPVSQQADLLSRRQRESGLTLVALVERAPDDTQSYAEKFWFGQEGFSSVWQNIRHSVDWSSVEKNGTNSMLWSDDRGDYVICAAAVPDASGLFLVTAEAIGRGLLTQLERISQGYEEYSRLKSLKKPLKLSFTLILGLLSLVVLFSSTWMAFRLSRDLTEPILALSRGTAQIASGDLDFQLHDTGKDELGQLVASFNTMASELKDNQENLKKLNGLLAERGAVLSQRNEYIEAVLDHITAGVVTLNDSAFILSMNKAAGEIFDTSPVFWTGRSLGRFLSAEHREIFQRMKTFLYENPQKSWKNELEFVRRGCYRKLMIQAAALPSSLHGGLADHTSENAPTSLPPSSENTLGSIVIVIEDITELSRVQRLAAWREVARRIAHEIKNPLTPIKLSAERLERRFGQNINDPVFSQCTNLIVKEVGRMQNMVSEFSSFASLPEVSLSEGNPDSLLTELITTFRTSHSSVNWRLEKQNLPQIRFDREALRRALFNVLGNAAEAVAQNSDEKQVVLRAKIANSALLQPEHPVFVMEIEDNGSGLSEEESARLFEPYFSRKPGGTGLGLAIVRSIIQDHSGAVSAENIPDSGTRIRIEIPVALG